MPSKRKKTLTVEQILVWVDAHHARTGLWPSTASGTIRGTHGEKWIRIDAALRFGWRGLAGGSSLFRLLAETGRSRPRRLTEKQILIWADAHHARTGEWPRATSGEVVGGAGERWSRINRALYLGLRGLPGGSSVASLLAAKRKVPSRAFNVGTRRSLTEEQILAWADAHHARTGEWPRTTSGRIPGTSENWSALNGALSTGCRGLPGGKSLRLLLRQRRGVECEHPLTVEQILAWADAHFVQTGEWPHAMSGPIAGTNETWSAINGALYVGCRGLPGDSTLHRLLAQRRWGRQAER